LVFGSEGENAKNWEEILRELSRRGVILCKIEKFSKKKI